MDVVQTIRELGIIGWIVVIAPALGVVMKYLPQYISYRDKAWMMEKEKFEYLDKSMTPILHNETPDNQSRAQATQAIVAYTKNDFDLILIKFAYLSSNFNKYISSLMKVSKYIYVIDGGIAHGFKKFNSPYPSVEDLNKNRKCSNRCMLTAFITYFLAIIIVVINSYLDEICAFSIYFAMSLMVVSLFSVVLLVPIKKDYAFIKNMRQLEELYNDFDTKDR